MKTVLPLALFVVVIFGVTLIWQNVGDVTPPDDNTNQQASKFSGPPLQIPFTTIGYNPAAPDIESRSFQGFYELDKTPIPVSFWFKNTHQVPVKIQATVRGCTSCTQARVGVVKEETFNKFVEQAMVGSIPTNPFAAMNLIPTLAAAQVSTSIQWQDVDFDNMEKKLEVPAAKSPDQPVLALFQMAISVVAIGSSDRRFVAVRAWPEGGTPSEYVFAANMIGVQPFEALEPGFKVPIMAEGAESRTYSVVVLSATRKLPDEYGSLLPFNPPSLSVNPPDSFIEVGKAVPLTPEEVLSARNQLFASKKIVPVRCGYAMKVTVHRQRPGQTPSEPDIGPFSRDLVINSPGTLYVPTVNISGNFQGLIGLTEGHAIDLKDFPGKTGTTFNATLVSDNKDVQVSWLKKETKPDFLEVTVGKRREENNRFYWDLTIVVPAGRLYTALPYDSFIVLKAELPSGERKIRLPIKGVGFAR